MIDDEMIDRAARALYNATWLTDTYDEERHGRRAFIRQGAIAAIETSGLVEKIEVLEEGETE